MTMAGNGGFKDVFLDALIAAKLVSDPQLLPNHADSVPGWWYHIASKRNVACFGVNNLVELSSLSFPASVLCIILLFGLLTISDTVIGDRAREIVGVIDIPVCFDGSFSTSGQSKTG